MGEIQKRLLKKLKKKDSSVLLEASTKCQLKCPVCNTGQGINKKNKIGWGDLKFKDFKKFVDENSRIKYIELSRWGEIFLNPDLKKIVKYAYKKEIYLSAIGGVNFNSVSESMLKTLVKYKFRGITISIDGATNKIYQIYRRGGDLNRVLKNIKILNKYKKKYASNLPKLNWQFVIFGHNEHQLPKVKKLAAKLGMDFKPKLNWNSWYSPIKDPEFVKKETGLEVADRKEYKKKFNEEYILPCTQLWNKPLIGWQGSLFGCCGNSKIVLGNVFKEGFENCLQGEKYLRMKKVLLGKEKVKEDLPCFNCMIYKRSVSKRPLKLENLGRV